MGKTCEKSTFYARPLPQLSCNVFSAVERIIRLVWWHERLFSYDKPRVRFENNFKSFLELSSPAGTRLQFLRPVNKISSSDQLKVRLQAPSTGKQIWRLRVSWAEKVVYFCTFHLMSPTAASRKSVSAWKPTAYVRRKYIHRRKHVSNRRLFHNRCTGEHTRSRNVFSARESRKLFS